MADTKITGLTELAATPASNDWYVVTDVSDTTMDASGTNKKLAATRVVHKDASGNVAVLGNFSVGTATAGAIAHIYSPSDEALRIAGTAATSNPYISFMQGTTRRSYIQHADSNDTLTLVSEYGNVSIKAAATLGTDSEAEYITVKAGGNIGIGNTSPNHKLSVLAGASATNLLSIAQTGVSNGFAITSNGTKLTYSYDDALAYTINGPTSIITTGASDTGLTITKTNASDTGFGLFIRSARTQNSAFYNILTYADYDGTPDPRFYVDGTGACAAYSFPSLSDGRLKNLDEPIENALDKIKAIKAYKYAWKNGNPEEKHIGFIAQEIQEQFPECVTSWAKFDKEGKELESDLLAVDYTKMIPILLQAINELAKKVDKLETK